MSATNDPTAPDPSGASSPSLEKLQAENERLKQEAAEAAVAADTDRARRVAELEAENERLKSTAKAAQESDAAEGEGESTRDLLLKLLEEQKQHRAVVDQLRAEVNSQKGAVPPAQSGQRMSEEDLLAARMEEIGQHEFYCPGCGALYDYPQKCNGASADRPHQPIEVVSTDELKEGDPAKHTAAPASL